jgi:cell division protein FtsA
MTVVPLQPKGTTRGPAIDKGRVLASLDIGSTKVCCLIAQALPPKHKNPSGDDEPVLKILGIGHQVSRGVKAGVVIDLDEAERAMRLAVDAAERMAQTTISEVVVNVSGGRPQSKSYSASVKVRSGQVLQADIDAAILAALGSADPGKRAFLHAVPYQFHLDEAKGVKHPTGMFGDTLTADVNLVTIEPAATKNMALAIERCHLGVGGYVIAPYAAARSVLAEDEMSLGITLIEMGGATTSVAVFRDGHMIFADVIPIGGQHITNDIARGLSTNIAHAERMKTLWGSALASAADDRETVAVPQLGERGVDTVHQIPRSMLTGIIRPRLEETFELVRNRLEASGVVHLAGRRAVLSGGASQLTGARELASHWLDKQVRHGSVSLIQGMPESAKSPGFAVAAGLLAHALKPDVEYMLPQKLQSSASASSQGYFARVGKWIAEGF